MAKTSYALALGSNRRSRHGSPAETVRAALLALGAERASSIHLTPALGPAGRSFANAAAIVSSELDPPEMLGRVKAIEREFGRRPGRRWGPRVLDIDIILWSGGAWAEGGLVVPHPEMRRRRFVLEPLAEIAADWRDPLTGATIRHLLFRLCRAAAG
jgi:2-amino-4-hydroxy-6-hydroxymethyldihydropteridine diphosphokinase